MEERITPLDRGKAAVARLREALAEKCREALEELLQLELDEVLGAVRSERTEDRCGYRNGSYERTVVTELGPTTVQMPRGRLDDGQGGTVEHQSEILPNFARHTATVVEAIQSCYLGGGNTRKISKMLQEVAPKIRTAC